MLHAGSVRAKRELLAACMTCPLCNKLLREATTISECLHTFCRKCIYEKLTDEEEADCCPLCKIDLGCVPVEKLRPDHNLQDVRSKVFPYKRRKVPISLPVRRKERSLSSLVVNTPRVTTQTGLTGRRAKAIARRAATLHGFNPAIDESVKKEDDNVEDCAENSSSPETLSSRRKVSSNVDPSNYTANRHTDNGRESFLDKAELWKPLNCLVEVANRTKALKSGPQSPVIKAELINGHDTEGHVHKTKIREHIHKSKVQDDKTDSVPTTPVLVKARRLPGVKRKRRELKTSAQALLHASGVTRERRISPIWFSLVASPDKEGDAPLPQISACYLRIKDGNLPVAFIQKYLVKKLDLASETEVEISFGGQPVVPTLPLHNLVELWLQTRSSQKSQVSVGTSAQDFVMVLAYGRKVPAP